MKTLHKTLKKKWFDMISANIKKHEYLEIKPYWIRRLCENFEAEYPYSIDKIAQLLVEDLTHDIETGLTFDYKHFDIVSANNGYSKGCPNVKWEHKGICIGEGKSEWGAIPGKIYFILKIGEIIK